MQKKLRPKMRFGLLLVAAALLGISPFIFGSVATAATPASITRATANSVASATLPTATCTLSGSTRTCDLWAKTGTLSLPGSVSVPIWGYSDTAGGAAQLPGPTLIANQGETLKVILHNTLAQSSSLSFPEQASMPDTVGVTTGNSKTYTFNTLQPGTSLYEAGLTSNGPRQVAMGLFGTLVIRPSGSANQAYSGGATFDDEAVLVFSEVDTALNNAPATFDMHNYSPKYWLINGKAYPQTAEINTTAGNKVLLRYLNAGLQDHSIGALGMHQTVIGVDGKPLPYSYQIVAETLAAGQSLDLIATVPTTAPAGAKYALYNAANHLDNSGARTASGTIQFGGMMTFLTVGTSSSGGDTTGPVTSNLALTSNPTTGSASVALSASISDVTTGNANVTAAEYFIDTLGSNGAGTAMTGTFGTPTVSANATISTATLTGLAGGNHTIFVHGKDALNNWGSTNTIVLNLDKAGPSTTGGTLSPNPTNGSASVAIKVTGDDSATGNSNVIAAEYYIDTTSGTGAALTIDPAGPAPTIAFTGTISASTASALSQGSHTVNVRSRDAFNQWGAFTALTLKVDKTGPTTSAVVASPNPNNGTLNFDINNPGIKLSATATDPSVSTVNSNVSAMEGFIDTAGANGTGIVFTPADAAFDSPTENGYVFIPPSVVQNMTQGSHTLYVHAQDAAGNWGTSVTTTLVIDKIAPVVSAVAATPNPTGGASTVTLSATVTDTTTAIAQAEWYQGTDPGVGNGTPITTGLGPSPANLSVSINVSGWTLGNHVLFVRAKDAATNWSAPASVTLNVTAPAGVIFSDGFESGTFAAWNNGNTTGGPVITATAKMVGNLGMQVAVNGTTLRYVIDNSPNNETTYRARFYFNPNGTSTGTNNAIPQDIFVGRNTGGTTIFRVQYQRIGTNPNFTYQVRVGTLVGGGTGNGSYTYTNWQTISNAAHSIEIAWQSAASSTLSLYVDSTTASQTLTGLNTNFTAYRIRSVRLGAVGGGTGMTGTEYFDAFASTRGTTVIGP